MREHSRLRKRVVAVVTGVSALLLLPVASFADSAEVTVSKDRVRVGEKVQVMGQGFTPGESVSIAVCGAADAAGRLACGKAFKDILVTSDGSVNATIRVREPGGACPCTAMIDTADDPPVTTRIDLLGYPMADKPRAPEVVIDSAVILDSEGIGHWFGFAPEPTLKIVLRNAGAAPAQPALDLTWRQGDSVPVSIVDGGGTVIEPGQSVEYSIPLTLGPLAHGDYTISGQVVVGDLFAPVEVKSSTAPWGLYVLLAVLLVGVPVVAVRRYLSPAAAARATSRNAASHTVPAQRTPARTADPAAYDEPSRSPAPPRRGRDARGPAYVGPPRLAATPLAPRPGTQPEQTASPLERLGSAAPNRAYEVDTTSVPLPVARQSVAPSTQTWTPTPPTPAQYPPAPPTPAPYQPPPPTPPQPWTPTPPTPAQYSSDQHQSDQYSPAPTPPQPWTPTPPTPAQYQQPTPPTPAQYQPPTPPQAWTPTPPTPAQYPPEPQRDATTVAEALSAIAERSAEAPARLPDPHAVPSEPGRRAERGGKRAARPARGGWITRR